jgi:hypothetical protein
MTKLEEKLLELGYQVDERDISTDPLKQITLWRKGEVGIAYFIEVVDGKMVSNWWAITNTIKEDLKALSSFEVFKGEKYD